MISEGVTPERIYIMCGRFAQHSSMQMLKKHFKNINTVTSKESLSYNICPTDDVLTLINQQEEIRAGKMRWGLIPSWSKSMKIGSKLINARIETIAEKPSFRNALIKRRCVVIADGYYEWQKMTGKQKQAWYITLKNNIPFGFAGIWEIWKNKQLQKIASCTIITTESIASIQQVHHRMPVILTSEAVHEWLDHHNSDKKKLIQILNEGQETRFQKHKVSSYVNSVSNKDIKCIQDI